jgi:cystathionine beta-lyase/cystathionine gamma-synthase
MQDLEAVAELARQKNIITVIDNSYASPLNQQPARHGIDIIVHSATKYLNGHSDVVAGVVCASEKIIRNIFYNEFMTLGGIIAPHDAWLMIRGMRTLQIRMERIASTARKVVAFLENHPAVEKVIYPGSSGYRQKALADKYMANSTGQFSITLRAVSPNEIETFCNHLQCFLLACSWGGHESLVYPLMVSEEVIGKNDPMRPWNLVRFYVGLEESETLIDDIDRALAKTFPKTHQ